MLTNTLNTNEVKDAAGTEVEFTRLSIGDRSTVFAKINESPSLQHRLTISHSETGSGTGIRRRSVVRIDKSSISAVDLTTVCKTSAYLVLDAPLGHLTATTELAAVVANLLSFCATTGAGTTVLFDGTGNGAKSLISGEI